MQYKDTKLSNEDYFNRYCGWLLAIKLAEWLGMKAGVAVLPIAADSATQANYYCFVIELPSGQVSVGVPSEFVEGNWKFFDASLIENADYSTQIKTIEDCLYGTLVNKHVLIIPQEKKEETE